MSVLARRAALGVIAGGVLALAGCGKKPGSVDPPAGRPSSYPRGYPPPETAPPPPGTPEDG